MQLWVFSKSGDSRCRHCFLLHHILQQVCTVEVCFVAGVHKTIVQQKGFVGLFAVADSGLQSTAALCSSATLQALEISNSATMVSNSATIDISDSATIEFSDSARIEIRHSAAIEFSNSVKIKIREISNSATIEISHSATFQLSSSGHTQRSKLCAVVITFLHTLQYIHTLYTHF